ncbi:MAG: Ig-like domain-containing protein [Candidatus Sulfotelmatobacter sp.]
MGKYRNFNLWFVVFLLLIFNPGCSSPGAKTGLVAPIVTSEMPLSASAGLCTAAVTATFSLPMNPTSINGATFTLAGPSTTAVSGTVSYDPSSTTAAFTPSSALLATTTYTATIMTGAADQDGIALANNFIWTFTTGNCVPPTVISVTPLVSVGVCPSTAASATFSQAMNPATINATTFTLTAGNPLVAVTGVVSYAGSTATFTPPSPLALSTLYTATITSGATDPSGVAMTTNFVWTFTTASVACTPPIVVTSAPANLATGLCPDTLLVAIFSHAMNPASINPTTFTLTSPDTPGLAVAGAVTYNVGDYTAVFTPTQPLPPDTAYTATITTGAQDLGDDSLATNYIWTFSTSPTACHTNVPLGSACSFGILAFNTVTNVNNPGTIVTGDLGISPGSALVGFPPGQVVGTIHAGDSVAQTAQDDLAAAYNYTAATPGGVVLAADIGGDTLVPGVYMTTSAQPSLAISGNLTLSGSGTYIFQIVSTLTTAAGTQVILADGASPQNVFWQVGSSATLGTYSIFQGIIMAQASVTLQTGATLDGSALARGAAVALDTNPITAPPCPGP